jgi:membrane protein required for colicin V production
MNGLDLAVVAVIVLSGLFAFARGFVREALSIVAWVGAAAIAVYGFDAVYPLTLKFVTTPFLAELVTGAGLFLSSLIALTMLTGYAARFVQESAASPVDRTLGLIFGAARGALIVSIAYLLLEIGLPPSDRPNWVNEAKSERYLAQGADFLRHLLPANWQLKGSSTVDTAERVLDQAEEARRAMRALENPARSVPSAPDQPLTPDYRPSERRDLDRLIQNAR